MGADNTYGEENWDTSDSENSTDVDKDTDVKVHLVESSITEAQVAVQLKELLTDMENIQGRIDAMECALAGYNAALAEIKGSLMLKIANATMNGAIILKPGKHPYLIAGYVVLIDFVFQSFNNKTIRDIEVTDIPVIDVSLFKTIKL